MNKKTKGVPLAKFSFALLPEEKVKVEKYARALSVTPSELAREAIRQLIYNLEKPSDQVTEEERELAFRVRKLEERVAAMLAKLTRASAQTLFFITLPYMHGGLPKEPLPEGAVKALWNQSRNFAGEWLRKVRPDFELDELEGSARDSSKTQTPRLDIDVEDDAEEGGD